VALLREALEHPEEGEIPRAELLRELGTALWTARRPEAAAAAAEEELRLLDPEAAVFAERRLELHRKLAKLYEHELADPEAALTHLRALVDAGETESEPLRREVAAEAEEALIAQLRRTGDAVELEWRLARRLAQQPDDVEGWLELARLRHEQLHRIAEAAQAYREVLARQPGCTEALRGLRCLSERLGDFDEVAYTLEAELDRNPALAPAERAALLRRLGEIAWRQLGSTTSASRAFAAALEAEPGNLTSLRALEELLESVEDWRGALDLYESEVEILGDTDASRCRQVWLRVAELARERTGDLRRALRGYEAARALAELAPEDRLAYAEVAQAAEDTSRFAEIYASWCDDPAAGAAGRDHLRLALHLEGLGRSEEALARVQRSLELDPSCAEAWEAASRLCEATGDSPGSACALEQAAHHLPDREAAKRLEAAANRIEATDPREALRLLRLAVERDPASVGVEAARVRAATACGDLATAQAAAERALSLDAANPVLEPGERGQIARMGAVAARWHGDRPAAARLYRTLLEIDPEEAAALEALGELFLELGDPEEARRFLERRLALETAQPPRPPLLVLLARTLERCGRDEEALARFEEALSKEPSCIEAHEGRVRLLEASERTPEAVRALRALAAACSEPDRAAAALVRAAQRCLDDAARASDAEGLLREALEVNPDSATAWLLLVQRLSEQGRLAETIEVSRRALELLDAGPERKALLLLRARALEMSGERRSAAETYQEITDQDPGHAEAALASARLYRGLGEWGRAAQVLEEAVQEDPGGNPTRTASLLHQLGRLLAGPLEDLDRALGAYRAALEHNPRLRDARAALADTLVQKSELWDEALQRHRELLSEEPTRIASLRGVLRIAQGRRKRGGEAIGLSILTALGAATPEERERATVPEAFPCSDRLDDPAFEYVRRVAHAASGEIASALGASSPRIEHRGGDPVARFRSSALVCEAELSAPALVPLSSDEVRTVLTLVARLVADADSVSGDGHMVNALASALGRRARRRIARLLAGTSIEALDDIDFRRWRAELRGLACAEALCRKPGDLRIALLALITDAEGRSLPPEADLCPLVAASPEASALLRRIVLGWLDAC
jgi:tetratricopeptide (TPR) repeat protein